MLRSDRLGGLSWPDLDEDPLDLDLEGEDLDAELASLGADETQDDGLDAPAAPDVVSGEEFPQATASSPGGDLQDLLDGTRLPMAQRLRVPDEVVRKAGLIRIDQLEPPDALVKRACDVGPTDPAQASVLLGAAALSSAHTTSDPRLSAALTLVAPLIARSDAGWLLGPAGAHARQHLMPNGWAATLTIWPRFRYAWREGMRRMLRTSEMDTVTLHSLDEVTRYSPSEPEPVSVSIQEQWAPTSVQAGLGLLGAVGTVFGLVRAFK